MWLRTNDMLNEVVWAPARSISTAIPCKSFRSNLGFVRYCSINDVPTAHCPWVWSDVCLIFSASNSTATFSKYSCDSRIHLYSSVSNQFHSWNPWSVGRIFRLVSSAACSNRDGLDVGRRPSSENEFSLASNISRQVSSTFNRESSSSMSSISLLASNCLASDRIKSLTVSSWSGRKLRTFLVCERAFCSSDRIFHHSSPFLKFQSMIRILLVHNVRSNLRRQQSRSSINVRSVVAILGQR